MNPITSIIESELTSAEELLGTKDIGPYELVEGRILPMSPTGGEHGLIETKTTIALGSFAASEKLGWVLNGEVGIYTGHDPDTIRAADVLFISKQRMPSRPNKSFLDVAPELVVEILSPTDTWHAINQKIDEYLAIGVKWVWVVVPSTRTLSVYRKNREVQTLTESDTLIGEDILGAFELKISALFED